MPQFGPSLSGPADLVEMLASAVADRPNDIALVSATAAWTWRELDRDVTRLAAHYHAMGLRPGDRIASLMPNRIELLLHYLACIKAGLVITPLNYRYTPPEIDYALNALGATVLLAHTERAEDVAASVQAAKLPVGLICHGGPIDGAAAFEDMIKSERPDASFPEPDFDAPALVFFYVRKYRQTKRRHPQSRFLRFCSI